jgi:hypothetical protein
VPTATPKKSQLHWDAENNFLVQLAGRKKLVMFSCLDSHNLYSITAAGSITLFLTHPFICTARAAHAARPARWLAGWLAGTTR